MKLMNARGVRDFPPEEKIARQEIVDTLRTIFEEYGFNPLETPIIERSDILSSKYAGGDEILKETFKFKDQGKRDLSLRYDLTVPFARFVGMNPNMKMPFKRYQIDRVYRDGPIKLGRYREFWQCDVDVVGTKSMLAETELLDIAAKVFKALGLKITIKLNNRKILDSIMKSAGVKEDKWIDAILSIDKLEKIGEKEVKKELEGKGIDKKSISKLFKILKKESTNSKTLTTLKKNLKKGIGEEGLVEIEELLKFLKSINVDVDFDPSLARGLSYYTGPVFEVFLKNSEIKSSVAGGGRYDNMIGDFLENKNEYPATGISFGLEVITDALSSKDKKKSVVQTYIIPIRTTEESLKITKELRDSGIKTDMDIIGRGVSKNLDFANVNKIPFAIIIGPKELEKKKVTLRDMNSGKEESLSVAQVIKKLK